MSTALETMGHATLLVRRGDEPVLATDPWLIGSVYWRSWWLSRPPDDAQLDAVTRAAHVYVTHSHPDHFHWPTIRQLRPAHTFHPAFPGYPIPEFLRRHGIAADVLPPWRWRDIGDGARIASVPVAIDDSVLVIDVPEATIVDINDAVARPSMLRAIRERLVNRDKPVIALRSYSPASVSASIFRNGVRIPLKSKRDYVDVARRSAELVGATHFIPFASQAVYLRPDTAWANEFKVTYDDLHEHWGDSPVALLPPHVVVDLATMRWTAPDPDGFRDATVAEERKVAERMELERVFEFSEKDCAALSGYLHQLPLLRWFFRDGIGFTLATSGRAFSYDTKAGTLDEVDREVSVRLTVPDAVLAEGVRNGILTDLGITMFVRVDTRVRPRLAYALFLLMGLRDYGHVRNWRRFVSFVWFYVVTSSVQPLAGTLQRARRSGRLRRRRSSTAPR